MTITQIIVELISETGGDTDDSSLSALWLKFVTAAIRRLPEKVRTRALSATTTATLAAASRTIAVPSDFEYPKEHGFYRVYDTQRVPITMVPDSTFNLYYRSESGAPQFVHRVASTFEFEVTADQAYTIGIDYWKDLSGTVVTGDTLERKLIEPVKGLAKYIYYTDYEEDQMGKGDKHFMDAYDLLDEIDSKDKEQEIGTHVSDE